MIHITVLVATGVTCTVAFCRAFVAFVLVGFLHWFLVCAYRLRGSFTARLHTTHGLYTYATALRLLDFGYHTRHILPTRYRLRLLRCLPTLRLHAHTLPRVGLYSSRLPRARGYAFAHTGCYTRYGYVYYRLLRVYHAPHLWFTPFRTTALPARSAGCRILVRAPHSAPRTLLPLPHYLPHACGCRTPGYVPRSPARLVRTVRVCLDYRGYRSLHTCRILRLPTFALTRLRFAHNAHGYTLLLRLLFTCRLVYHAAVLPHTHTLPLPTHAGSRALRLHTGSRFWLVYRLHCNIRYAHPADAHCTHTRFCLRRLYIFAICTQRTWFTTAVAFTRGSHTGLPHTVWFTAVVVRVLIHTAPLHVTYCSYRLQFWIRLRCYRCGSYVTQFPHHSLPLPFYAVTVTYTAVRFAARVTIRLFAHTLRYGYIRTVTVHVAYRFLLTVLTTYYTLRFCGSLRFCTVPCRSLHTLPYRFVLPFCSSPRCPTTTPRFACRFCLWLVTHYHTAHLHTPHLPCGLLVRLYLQFTHYTVYWLPVAVATRVLRTQRLVAVAVWILRVAPRILHFAVLVKFATVLPAVPLHTYTYHTLCSVLRFGCTTVYVCRGLRSWFTAFAHAPVYTCVCTARGCDVLFTAAVGLPVAVHTAVLPVAVVATCGLRMQLPLHLYTLRLPRYGCAVPRFHIPVTGSRFWLFYLPRFGSHTCLTFPAGSTAVRLGSYTPAPFAVGYARFIPVTVYTLDAAGLVLCWFTYATAFGYAFTLRSWLRFTVGYMLPFTHAGCCLHCHGYRLRTLFRAFYTGLHHCAVLVYCQFCGLRFTALPRFACHCVRTLPFLYGWVAVTVVPADFGYGYAVYTYYVRSLRLLLPVCAF